MCKLRLLLAALFTAVTIHTGCASPATNWAVLVGVDNYLKEGVTKLNYAGASIKLLAQILRDKGGYLDKNIFLYTTDTPEEADRPTLTNLILRLDWLKQNAGPDDTILFFFAGHSITMDGETFLLTQEADARTASTLVHSSLRGSDLFSMIGQSKARNTLVFLDACRNNSCYRLDESASRNLTYSKHCRRPLGRRANSKATMQDLLQIEEAQELTLPSSAANPK